MQVSLANTEGISMTRVLQDGIINVKCIRSYNKVLISHCVMV